MRLYVDVAPAARQGVRAGAFLAALVCSVGSAPKVLAQAGSGNVLTGVWRAGGTQIDVAIESWGEDCGPRPQSSRSAGGGIVNIEQTAGQLVIHGRGQDIRSDACWSRNTSMKRQSTGFANNLWTTRCRTGANDPREEQGTYTLKIAGPDTLTYQDVSRYNWTLNQSHCVATFTTIQTLTRRDGAADTQAASPEKPAKQPAPAVKPAAPPEPEEKEKVCTPGAPYKVALRPKRAEIEVSERVCFRARIADKNDCAIRDQAVQWSVSHSKALRGTLNNGCFTAADTAAEAEGEFKILATLGPLRAEATVSVHPVDLSSLIAKRLGGGALTGFDEPPPLPAAPRSVTRVATRNEPIPGTASPRKLVGIVLGVAATALALAALWLSRRRPASLLANGPSNGQASRPPPPPPPAPRAHTRVEVGPAPPPPPPPPPARAAENITEPERQLPSAHVNPAPLSSEPWICPKCRVGYPAQQQTCPKDGTPLLPYSEFSRNRKRTEEEKKKKCPRCGSVFPSHAAFCAEDGTPLIDA